MSAQTHGCSKKGSTTSEYSIWQAMKSRCYNEKTEWYHIYGGAGVVVCDRWLNSFENFLEDMGERPSKKHSLDRFPNKEGNYEPSNCRWATQIEQMNNYSKNRILTYNGEEKSISEWSRIIGLSISGIEYRLDKLKWSEEKTISTPKRKLKMNTWNVNNRKSYAKKKLLLILFILPLLCFCQPKKDTIPCVMLVCDTTKIHSSVYWQYGYSVREWNSIYVTYLDAEKNKLPKNIIVWMAKKI